MAFSPNFETTATIGASAFDGDVVDQQVRLKLPPAVVDYIQPDGRDLQIYAADGTRLHHDIERVVPSVGIYGGFWTVYPRPQAVSNGTNKTWLVMTNWFNNQLVYQIDHADSHSTTSFVLNNGDGSGDPHTSGAIIRNGDGKLVAAYESGRIGEYPTLRYRVAASADAIDFGNESEIASTAGSYIQLSMLSSESDKLYMFWQDTLSDIYIGYSTSTNGGATFSAATNLIEHASGDAIYPVFADNGTDKIFIAVHDRNPGSTASIYGGYITSGNLYDLDGTLVGAIGSGPYAPGDLTLLYNRTVGDVVWCFDAMVQDGQLYVLYSRLHGATDMRLHRVTYAASTATTEEVTWTTESVAGSSNGQSAGYVFADGDVDSVTVVQDPDSAFSAENNRLVEYRRNSGVWRKWIDVSSQRDSQSHRFPVRVYNPSEYLTRLWLHGEITGGTTQISGEVTGYSSIQGDWSWQGHDIYAWFVLPAGSSSSGATVTVRFSDPAASDQVNVSSAYVSGFSAVRHGNIVKGVDWLDWSDLEGATEFGIVTFFDWQGSPASLNPIASNWIGDEGAHAKFMLLRRKENDGGALRFAITDSGSNIVTLDSTAALSVGEYVISVMAKQGTGIRMWRNGVKDAATTAMASAVGSTTVANTHVGLYHGDVVSDTIPASLFAGNITFLLLLNEEWSDDQVEAFSRIVADQDTYVSFSSAVDKQLARGIVSPLVI